MDFKALSKGMGRYLIATLLAFIAGAHANAATLSGTVYGDGEALSSVTLTITDAASGEFAGTSTSDGTGSYSFELQDGTYDMAVNAPAESGFGASSVENIVVSAVTETRDVFLVGGASVVSGRIVDTSGSPVAGMEVVFSDYAPGAGGSEIARVDTDVAGDYSIELSSGSYGVSLERWDSSYDGIHPERRTDYLTIKVTQQLEVNGDTTHNITLPSSRLSGKVVDSSETGVVDAKMSFWVQWTYYPPEGGYQHRQQRTDIWTDTAGNYSLKLLHGPAVLTLAPPVGSSAVTTVFTDIDIAADSQRDFILADPLVVSGVVSDADGIVMAGVDVVFDDQASGTEVGSATTDNSGFYSMELAPSTYEISAESWLSSWNQGVSEENYLVVSPVTVALPVVSNVTHDISLPMVTLFGKTVDASGEAIAGVELKSFHWAESFPGFSQWRRRDVNVLSDADGNYSMRMMKDQDSLVLTPPAGSEFAVTVVDGLNIQASQQRDFVVGLSNTVTGVISDVDGVPVSNLRVVFNDASSGARIGYVYTDGEGRYGTTLADGTYSIDVETSSHIINQTYQESEYDLLTIAPVTPALVVSGGSLTHDITLPMVTLTGRTTDKNIVPVEGVKIDFYRAWTGSVGAFDQYQFRNVRLWSDDNGDYIVNVLQDHDSQVIVPLQGSGFASSSVDGLDIQSSQNQNIILTLPDTTAPIIISGPLVSAITDTSAVVEWQTDEPANSSVSTEAGVVSDPVYTTHHSVILTSLTAETLYNATVSSSDETGNGPSTSIPVTFTTIVTPDTQPPTILTGPIITSITDTTAVVRWTTDEPTTGSVNYRIEDVMSAVIPDDTLAEQHEVKLTGLSPDTRYELYVYVSDAAHNSPDQCCLLQSFTTQPAPDTAAPVIVAGPMVINITDTEAMVLWETDEPAVSGVSFNDGEAHGVVRDENLVTSHSVRLTGLQSETLYNYTVSSADAVGNGPTLSEESNFTTAAVVDQSPPVITEAIKVVGVTHQSAVIHWRTDEASSSIVDYGLSPDELNMQTVEVKLKGKHVVQLTGLTAGTEYYFRASSIDAQGLKVQSGHAQFTTNKDLDEQGPEFKLLPLILDQTESTATLYWETNELTTSVVEYGQGQSKNNRLTVSELKTEHQVTLTNLKVGKSYSFAVEIIDQAGNKNSYESNTTEELASSLGEPQSLFAKFLAGIFTAPSAHAIYVEGNPGDIIINDGVIDVSAPVISNLQVLSVSDQQALVYWQTNELADGQVNFALSGQDLSGSAGDIEKVSEHLIVLTNLSAGSSYDIQVSSTDVANNEAVSGVLTFSTSATADTAAPVITAEPIVTDVTDQTVTVTWHSDEYSSASVQYGLSAESLVYQLGGAGLDTAHQIYLGGLSEQTTYYYRVVLDDISGNQLLGDVLSFTTVTQLTDTDGDELPDIWEIEKGYDPFDASDAQADEDGDGLSTLAEYQVGTNPNHSDSDLDGLPDDVELNYGLDPLSYLDGLIARPTPVDSDFNGDGRSDMLWRNNSDDQVKVMLNDALALQVDLINKSARNSDWSVQLGDLNGDARVDMLWRNTVTNSLELEISSENGDVYRKVVRPNRFSSWSSDIADFNGDGREDIFWREPATGKVRVDISAADGTVARTEILPDKFGAWTHQLADFNWNGRTDILWRKKIAGKVWIAMTDVNGNQDFVKTHFNKWSGWTSSLGDFNGDRSADILWRNTTSGDVKVAIVGLNGEQYSVANHYDKYSAWTHTIGDFNGDGRDDILWRKLEAGIVKIAISGVDGVQASIANHYNKWEAWQHTIGDYNGDGRDDILWRKPSIGTVKISISDGNGLQGSVANHYDKLDSWQLLR